MSIHIGRLDVRANLEAAPDRRDRRRPGDGADQGSRSGTTSTGNGRHGEQSPRHRRRQRGAAQPVGQRDGRRRRPASVRSRSPPSPRTRSSSRTRNVEPRLNLFLYRVTPNLGWRNAGTAELRRQRLAAHQPAARARPALPAHRLRDDGLPGRDPARVRHAPPPRATGARPGLDPPGAGSEPARPVDPAARVPGAVSAADLADQLEAVTITTEPMDTEEMSRLWSAIQAHYRPTAAYVVSVVLIESTRPDRSALPVLSRGGIDPTTQRDRGVRRGAVAGGRRTRRSRRSTTPDSQPAVALGDTVSVSGHHLDGTDVTVRVRAPTAEHAQRDPPGRQRRPHRPSR